LQILIFSPFQDMSEKTKLEHIKGVYLLASVILAAFLGAFATWYFNQPGVQEEVTEQVEDTREQTQQEEISLQEKNDEPVNTTKESNSQEVSTSKNKIAVPTPEEVEKKSVLQGKVTDSEGNAIEGVLISFGSYDIKTDIDGKFSLPLSDNSEKKLSVSKSGYKAWSRYHTPSNKMITIELNSYE